MSAVLDGAGIQLSQLKNHIVDRRSQVVANLSKENADDRLLKKRFPCIGATPRVTFSITTSPTLSDLIANVNERDVERSDRRCYRFGFVTFGAPFWAARCTGISLKYASHVGDSSMR
jgi:hypothetical protein